MKKGGPIVWVALGFLTFLADELLLQIDFYVEAQGEEKKKHTKCRAALLKGEASSGLWGSFPGEMLWTDALGHEAQREGEA